MLSVVVVWLKEILGLEQDVLHFNYLDRWQRYTNRPPQPLCFQAMRVIPRQNGQHMNTNNRIEHSKKTRVQRQFGASAEAYATSGVHAKGASLNLLKDAIDLQPTWRVLDVATGAGHTAHAIAPFVDRVVSSDLTFEMLLVSRRLAIEKGKLNVDQVSTEAGRLAFSSDSFDLVTCRIAAHHFHNIPAFISESVRVLHDGGILAVVDNIVPGGFRTRKAEARLSETGRFINAFDRLRDPSHVQSFSRDQWLEFFYQSGLRVHHHETIEKQIDFDRWAKRMNVAEDDTTRLKSMLRQAPSQVREFYKPQFIGERILFNLTELILIGFKEL
jgi:ubiquinone/menaquinone biosynthesis C-methylase UbiE